MFSVVGMTYFVSPGISQDKQEMVKISKLCYNKVVGKCSLHLPTDTLNLISAGQGEGIITCLILPCLHYGGVFVPGKIICVHGITPKYKCRLCRNEAARISNHKHYDPARNKTKYQADRFQQLARMVNRAAQKYGAPGIVTAEMYRELTSGPCDYCGQVGLPMEVDHIIPMSKGGTNEVSNLHGSCRYCNRSKAWFGESEFLSWLRALRSA